MLAIAPTFDGRRTIPSRRVRQIILDLLQLGPQDRVLEIGTGSATQTNEFAAAGATVHSVELEPWVDSTVITGDCVFLHSGNGALGLPDCAPYTAIVATCGIEQIPKAWVEQLAEDGRLVAPIGVPGVQRLTLFRKQGSELVPQRVAAYVRFQMLVPKPRPKPAKYQPDSRQ